MMKMRNSMGSNHTRFHQCTLLGNSVTISTLGNGAAMHSTAVPMKYAKPVK